MSDLSARFNIEPESQLIKDLRACKNLSAAANLLNCQPQRLSEISGHPDRADCASHVMARAKEEIAAAPSGCMIDMTLHDLNTCNRHISARISEDDRNALVESITQRVEKGIREEDRPSHREIWQEYGKDDCAALVHRLPPSSRQNPVEVQPETRQLAFT